MIKDWRLNERHYGAFQGRSKVDLADVLTYETVREYRAGYDAKPPALPGKHALSPLRERKYEGVATADLPLTESLKDCLGRVLPVYDREGKGGFNVTSTCECSDEMCQRKCPLFENSTSDDLSSKTMSGN